MKMSKELKKREFALVEFDDSCDESDTLIEVIPSKWLFDNNTKCKYPPKKDKLKTTRLVMSRIDPGQDWDIYNLRLHHYYNTYNTALKATKTVLEGEVARTDAETDYDQPRKKKKNKKYISSSEDEELDNPASHVPRGTSSEIPAPNSLLPNKLKELIKNKPVKISTKQSIKKDTSMGKSLSCNESSVKSSGHLKLTHHNITLEENPIKQHSLLNETVQQKYCSPKDCSTEISDKFVITEPLQSNKTKPLRKLHSISQHLDKENYLNFSNTSSKYLSPQLTTDNDEQPTTSRSNSSTMSMSTLPVHMEQNLFRRKLNASPNNVNKAKSSPLFDEYGRNNEHKKNLSNTINSETLQDESEDDVLEKEKTLMSVDNEKNQASPNSPPSQGLSNAERDLLTTTLNHFKKLHGPVVSNLDRDLLRDISSKLDILLINQRRILNEIFPGEAIVERPENCPPLPLRDEKSFKEFNKFLKNKIAYSQFVSYLHAHIVDGSDQWSAAASLMSIILHNDLARLVSWKGTGGVKISFYGTQIKEALFYYLIPNVKHPHI